MKDLLLDVVKSIVDKPDEVSIDLTESENTLIYELKVGEGDVGKVIGKKGKNVGSIRTLLSAATAKAGGKVHGGFQQEVNDLWMDVLAEIEHNDQLKVRKDVYMTGHSLGAAMATIAATRYQPHELFTFGSPRVGGKHFVKNIKCPHLRFMNNNDIVCRIPPAWLGFRHHGEMIYFNRFGDRAAKSTWTDKIYGVLNSWKRFKFFDAIVDHGMPNYVKAINKLAKS